MENSASDAVWKLSRKPRCQNSYWLILGRDGLKEASCTRRLETSSNERCAGNWAGCNFPCNRSSCPPPNFPLLIPLKAKQMQLPCFFSGCSAFGSPAMWPTGIPKILGKVQPLSWGLGADGVAGGRLRHLLWRSFWGAAKQTCACPTTLTEPLVVHFPYCPYSS